MEKQNNQSKLDELARKVMENNSDAYRQLLTAIAPALRIYFRNQFRLGEQAEDLTQETLIAVHTKFHTYRNTQPFVPWLYAIAKYKAIDYLRAQKRRPIETEMPANDIFPAVTDSNEHGDALHKALATLSNRDYDLIKLAKLDGLSLNEISARMNISLAAVKVGIHRAMKRITGIAERDER